MNVNDSSRLAGTAFSVRDNTISCERSHENSRVRNKRGFDVHQTAIVKGHIERVRAL